VTDRRILHPDLFAQLSGKGNCVVFTNLHLGSKQRPSGMPISVIDLDKQHAPMPIDQHGPHGVTLSHDC
jgi:hypothetical protein